MKYFLIAGEASGDLHAAGLMRALQVEDPEAEFHFYGGDEMQRVGGTLLCHYRELAFMGIGPVLRHLPTILRGMKRCKREIAAWQPDVVILVDYPGFNLSIAHFVRRQHLCPVFYYIPPKIWAWREGRIRRLRRDVDAIFSILPFEVDYYARRHKLAITYVGNPTVDEVAAFQASQEQTTPAEGETKSSLLALLPGSRRQELADNLLPMLLAAAPLLEEGWQVSIAVAPSLPLSLYRDILSQVPHSSASSFQLVEADTYHLLSRADAALVTSGTATLETALFRVPQIVCYNTPCGPLVSRLQKLILHVRHISLVNLIADASVVSELVGNHVMKPDHILALLRRILPGGSDRAAMLHGYDEMARRLGPPGAPAHAARAMMKRLGKR